MQGSFIFTDESSENESGFSKIILTEDRMNSLNQMQEFVQQPMKVAIRVSGKAKCGKSTLCNALINFNVYSQAQNSTYEENDDQHDNPNYGLFSRHINCETVFKTLYFCRSHDREGMIYVGKDFEHADLFRSVQQIDEHSQVSDSSRDYFYLDSQWQQRFQERQIGLQTEQYLHQIHAIRRKEIEFNQNQSNLQDRRNIIARQFNDYLVIHSNLKILDDDFLSKYACLVDGYGANDLLSKYNKGYPFGGDQGSSLRKSVSSVRTVSIMNSRVQQKDQRVEQSQLQRKQQQPQKMVKEQINSKTQHLKSIQIIVHDPKNGVDVTDVQESYIGLIKLNIHPSKIIICYNYNGMLGGNINATERDSFTEQVFRLIPKYLKNRVYESARKICENHNDKSKAFYLTHQITAIDEFLRTNNLCVNSQVESILSLSQKKESRQAILLQTEKKIERSNYEKLVESYKLKNLYFHLDEKACQFRSGQKNYQLVKLVNRSKQTFHRQLRELVKVQVLDQNKYKKMNLSLIAQFTSIMRVKSNQLTKEVESHSYNLIKFNTYICEDLFKKAEKQLNIQLCKSVNVIGKQYENIKKEHNDQKTVNYVFRSAIADEISERIRRVYLLEGKKITKVIEQILSQFKKKRKIFQKQHFRSKQIPAKCRKMVTDYFKELQNGLFSLINTYEESWIRLSELSRNILEAMGLGYTVEQATSILAASTSVGLGIAAIIAMPLLAIPGGIALGIAGVSLFLKQKKRKKHDQKFFQQKWRDFLQSSHEVHDQITKICNSLEINPKDLKGYEKIKMRGSCAIEHYLQSFTESDFQNLTNRIEALKKELVKEENAMMQLQYLPNQQNIFRENNLNDPTTID